MHESENIFYGQCKVRAYFSQDWSMRAINLAEYTEELLKLKNHQTVLLKHSSGQCCWVSCSSASDFHDFCMGKKGFQDFPNTWAFFIWWRRIACAIGGACIFSGEVCSWTGSGEDGKMAGNLERLYCSLIYAKLPLKLSDWKMQSAKKQIMLVMRRNLWLSLSWAAVDDPWAPVTRNAENICQMPCCLRSVFPLQKTVNCTDFASVIP